jgi:hypothetical protein
LIESFEPIPVTAPIWYVLSTSRYNIHRTSQYVSDLAKCNIQYYATLTCEDYSTKAIWDYAF